MRLIKQSSNFGISAINLAIWYFLNIQSLSLPVIIIILSAFPATYMISSLKFFSIQLSLLFCFFSVRSSNLVSQTVCISASLCLTLFLFFLLSLSDGQMVRALGRVTYAPAERVRNSTWANAHQVKCPSLWITEIDETCNLSQMLSVYFWVRIKIY